MFNSIREEETQKFLELKIWLQSLNDSSPSCNIEKGLFFVYIYGIYESTIRSVIQETINALNSSGITINQCIYDLYALIFAPEYDSLQNVGHHHMWDKRLEISKKMSNNPQISISNTIIPTDGRNFNYKQLDSLAKSFGLTQAILPSPESKGYISEMVINRNAIAHGEKTPKEVGRANTIDDLRNKYEHIYSICDYIINIYEVYIIREHFRRKFF